jgi:hypothetical protein
MEQFDIKEFAQMFDAALASDNPAVKKALRNFMMVAAIVHAEEQTDEERLMGPLETLVKKVSDLERMVYELQNTRTYRDHKDKYYQDYYNTPTWVYNPNTSVSTTSGTTWKDTLGYSAEDIYELMKDLKFNENKSD